MRMDYELKSMVMSFRVTELQALLNYAGQNKSGRKNELQCRALELLKSKSPSINIKVRELYKMVQASYSTQVPTASASLANSNQVPSGRANNNVLSKAYYPNANQFSQTEVFNPTAESDFLNGSKFHLPPITNIRFKLLPFFDVKEELVKGYLTSRDCCNRDPDPYFKGITCFSQARFTFCLTPKQAANITASKELIVSSHGEAKIVYNQQIQLRICKVDKPIEQEDNFPQSLSIKVNGKLVALPTLIPSNRPGVEPKRPSRPLNITNYVRLSPICNNEIDISWSSSAEVFFAMGLFIVHKLTASDLLERIKKKGSRPAVHTRTLIKSICGEEDGDIMLDQALKVSIACPLGKCRMTLPCRSLSCKHLQCFDAQLFLQMNERKPTWVCPVCHRPLPLDDLQIDGYFEEILHKLPEDAGNDVEVLNDGSWAPISIKKEMESLPPKKIRKKNLDSTICIEDEEDIKVVNTLSYGTNQSADTSEKSQENKENKKEPILVDLTEDSDDEQPLAKLHSSTPPSMANMISEHEKNSENEKDVRRLRPRKRAPNYAEDSDSSTNDGSNVVEKLSPERERSPACITLHSNSPSPEPVVTNCPMERGHMSSNLFKPTRPKPMLSPQMTFDNPSANYNMLYSDDVMGGLHGHGHPNSNIYNRNSSISNPAETLQDPPNLYNSGPAFPIFDYFGSPYSNDTMHEGRRPDADIISHQAAYVSNDTINFSW